MADEELDAALVERVREATFGKPSFYTDVATETLRVKRALLSLPIPAAALTALARGEAVVRPKPVLRPLAEWHEDFGPVLWWILPLQEPPHVGDPNDDAWPGYHTHWTPIECPEQPLPAPPGSDHDGSR